MLDRLRDTAKAQIVKLNPYSEAAKEPANVLSLTGLAALSMATLNPMPLLVGAVAEAAYLLTVPDTDWYQRLVHTRELALMKLSVAERREALKQQILPKLYASLRERFLKMEVVRAGISADLVEGNSLYSDIFARLDELLERFLTLAETDHHFRTYLLEQASRLRSEEAAAANAPKRPGGPQQSPGVDMTLPRTFATLDWVEKVTEYICERYRVDLGKLEKQVAAQTDDDTLAVLRKRSQVLEQRLEYVEKIHRFLVKLSAQLDLLEDTFGLIHDQISARPPQEVLTEVEDVVMRTTLNVEVMNELGAGLSSSL